MRPPVTAQLVTHIIKEYEHILDRWSANPVLDHIVVQLKLSRFEYREKLAAPVLNYLLTILKGEKRMGDCPVMREVITTFYARGLKVEDVYLNCTGLKNAIIETCFDAQVASSKVSGLIAILDNNLYNILAIYSERFNEQNRLIKKNSRIIEEYVILTVTDTDGLITYVSDAFSELSGYPKEALLGNSHTLIRHPDMSDDFFKKMWKTIKAGEVWKGKIKNRKKSGSYFIAKTEIIPVKDKEGNIVEYMAIRHDITDKEMSQLDALTGLYNRATFDKCYTKAFEKQEDFALLIADIDYFKGINDAFGHSEGDKVIKHFAEILRNSVRENDICCRWGGEEFVIMLSDIDLVKAQEIAERIRTAFESSKPIRRSTLLSRLEIDEAAEYSVTCSIGVTEKRKNDLKKELFERVDSLLYEAKRSGRNRTVSR